MFKVLQEKKKGFTWNHRILIQHYMTLIGSLLSSGTSQTRPPLSAFFSIFLSSKVPRIVHCAEHSMSFLAQYDTTTDSFSTEVSTSKMILSYVKLTQN